MFATLRAFVDSFRGEPRPDKLAALQPRVTPDARDAEALAQRFAQLAYCPETPFHRDQRQPRLAQ